MSEITMSVPEAALSALRMTPDQFGVNRVWRVPSSSTRSAGCHMVRRRGWEDPPDCLPDTPGRLRRGLVPLNVRGIAAETRFQ